MSNYNSVLPTQTQTIPQLSSESPQPSSPTKPTRIPSNSDMNLDVFTSLTDIKPGTIPLLVRLPNNDCEQIEVPLTSTVDDIMAAVGKETSTSADDLRLSFGNVDLPPGATLLDTNIVDAYEHAGSLLQIIDAGHLDASTKTAALDSACAVVESVSNGIKDMDALCAAAMENASTFPNDPTPPSPSTAGLVAAGAAEAERDTPKEIDPGEFKMLNSILSGPAKSDLEPDGPPAASPSQLARSLSRRLPLLFPPSAAATLSDDPTQSASQLEEAPVNPQENQPSISSIREARRRLRQAQAESPKPPAVEVNAANAVTIGMSTNGAPLPANLPGRDSASQRAPSGSGRESAAMMAAKAKSTWLEDVMKTWEVKFIRQSGVLEKSKEGQEISEYLNELDAEAHREVETAEIARQKVENVEDGSVGTGTETGTEFDEEHEIDGAEGNTSGEGSQFSPQGNADVENGIVDVQKSMANFGLAASAPGAKDSASQARKAQTAAAAVILNSSKPLRHVQQPPHVQHGQTPPPGVQRTSRASTPMSTNGPGNDVGMTSDHSPMVGGKPPVVVRQATKIAPAPNVPTAISPGVSGVLPNGMYPNNMYPSGMAPSGVWRPQPTAPAPKKRGRKRKNPELTEEERALVRKEQNRESAKLSRVRRKVIAAEYEGRLNALIGENTMLRKQVEGLNNRLVYLQSLLTVSVRQESGHDGRRQ